MNIGKERYGIDANAIVEVTPLVRMDQVPMTDACILGIFNYRGAPTPVIDLCYLFTNIYCERKLSSRIMITDIPVSKDETRKIGLVAESVTEVIKCEAEKLMDSGIKSDHAEFLGSVYKHNNELIQIIDAVKILPESISIQLTSQVT
jgi:chemotaxis-related protein WspB